MAEVRLISSLLDIYILGRTDMYRVKLKVRKKGQVTLPVVIRKLWSLDKDSEILLSFNDRYATFKPVKKISVRESSGALGAGDENEIELAVLDSELIPLYYEKKYGDASERGKVSK